MPAAPSLGHAASRRPPGATTPLPGVINPRNDPVRAACASHWGSALITHPSPPHLPARSLETPRHPTTATTRPPPASLAQAEHQRQPCRHHQQASPSRAPPATTSKPRPSRAPPSTATTPPRPTHRQPPPRPSPRPPPQLCRATTTATTAVTAAATAATAPPPHRQHHHGCHRYPDPDPGHDPGPDPAAHPGHVPVAHPGPSPTRRPTTATTSPTTG